MRSSSHLSSSSGSSSRAAGPELRTRRLGKTGRQVSEVGFGAWAIGGSWGDVDDERSYAALVAAADAGVTFFDTADVYGDGRSERLLGRLLRERDEELVVATKFGRRAPLDPAEYSYDNLRGWLERSLGNLGVAAVDVVQLHCPPGPVYDDARVFAACERLVDEGLARAYGVSVERVDEALQAIDRPGVATVQIVFNLLRQRPAERFLAEAQRRDVGVIARVPLASGLLTGKFDAATTFAADDHRAFNRHGEAFDVGETFAGVPYEVGLAAVERLRELVPAGATLAQTALRWILMFDAVSTVIPGARDAAQARTNAAAAALPPLSEEAMRRAEDVYRELVAPHVHQRW